MKIGMKKTKPAVTVRVWGALFAWALLLGSCPDPTLGKDDPGPPPPNPADQLARAVYGGLGPGGEWVSLAFQSGGRVSAVFSGDTPAQAWTYAYGNNRSGSIDGDGSPGAFTLSEDDGVLSFANYGGRGLTIALSRLRSSDLIAADSPAGLAALPEAGLEGSAWGGSVSQGGWLVIFFKAQGGARGYFSGDTLPQEWPYAYQNRSGSIDGGGPGAFSISASGAFLMFNAYPGAADTFKRYYQEGTPWTISGVRISPEAATAVPGGEALFTAAVQGTGGFPQGLVWSLAGADSPHTRIENGKLTVAEDEGPGSFTVRAAASAAPDRYATAAVVIAAPSSYLPSLLGTVWVWNSGWGNRTITFDKPDTCVFVDDLSAYYQEEGRIYTYTDTWTYDSATGRGNITGGFSPGKFQLLKDNTIMHFISFSVYGHGADFTREDR